MDRTLIADINMRFMTGVELYAHLVERGDAIPTILMTAYVDDAVRDKALKDGVIGYLRTHSASTPGRSDPPVRIAQAAAAALGCWFAFQFHGSRSTILLAG